MNTNVCQSGRPEHATLPGRDAHDHTHAHAHTRPFAHTYLWALTAICSPALPVPNAMPSQPHALARTHTRALAHTHTRALARSRTRSHAHARAHTSNVHATHRAMRFDVPDADHGVARACAHTQQCVQRCFTLRFDAAPGRSHAVHAMGRHGQTRHRQAARC
eukprot:174116-Chlamydomonas_euryale.AAC.2